MRDKQFYYDAGQSFQQKISLNLKYIDKNNKRLDNEKLAFIERKNLEADNIQRHKAIKTLKAAYNDRLKKLEFDAPEATEWLRQGYEE